MSAMSPTLSKRLAHAFRYAPITGKNEITTWIAEASAEDVTLDTLEDMPEWAQELVHAWEEDAAGIESDEDEFEQDGPMVVAVLNGYEDPKIATSVEIEDENVSIRYSDGTEESIVAAADTMVKSRTGIITFSDSQSGTDYSVRPIEESDGYWLSRYQTALPEPALTGLVSQTNEEDGQTVNYFAEDGESMVAFQERGETDIIGVTYTNKLGKWVRIGGDWLHAAHNDDQFNDSVALDVNPDTVNDFLQVFDGGPLSAGDVKKYLSPIKG